MDKILSIDKRFYSLLIATGFIMVGGVFAFPGDYLSSTNSIIGFCLLPIVFFIHGKSQFNPFYFLFTLLFGCVGYIYHVKIFYFLTLAFYLLFCVELLFGKINSLMLFLIVLMSPVFLQINVIFGFPIRLYLSKWAGHILSATGMDVKVQGNLILLNGFDFAVDEACMGLSMLAISMLIGVFVLAHQYRITNKRLHFKFLLAFFAIVFALSVLANLFRIIALVFFKILPHHPMHEVVGILCLLGYVLIPLFFLSRWSVAKFGYQNSITEGNSTPKLKYQYVVLMLGLLVSIIGITSDFKDSEKNLPHANVKLDQLPATKMNNGITKFYDGELLVYVKPIPEFFSGEHTPLICWKGSGYKFKNIRKENINGHEIYFGSLQRDEDVLQTAWWYCNGKIETIDQLEWRGVMLVGGHRFNLVNVTAKDESRLKKRLTEIFNKDAFKIAL